DATMSRQPTWDLACALQADMFREAAALGSLDIRLVYYRGLNECRATGWISDSTHLAKLMSKIDCQGGNTQIGKVLSEARREAVASGVRAVVFVGDAMEESVDDLCARAGELGLLKVPVFMFQEGHDAVAEQAFREIARLTGGAWCRFDPGAAAQLRELLRAANPVVLARGIKIGGGVVALAVAAFTGLKGELAVAIPIGIFGAGLLGWSPFGASGFGNIGAMFGGGSARRSPGQSSRVRS